MEQFGRQIDTGWHEWNLIWSTSRGDEKSSKEKEAQAF